jgi:hypothetical protein
MTRASLKAREKQQPIVLKKKKLVSAHLEKKKRKIFSGERQASCAVRDSPQAAARQMLAGHI